VDLPLTLPEFEERAAGAIERGAFDYFAGGAGDEITLRDSVAAWQRLALRPRVLVDASRRSLEVTVLGRRRPHPLIVAPMAHQRLATPDGERATARAAVATQTPMCLATLASTGIDELAAAEPGLTRWFQVYVLRDRGATTALVEAAAAHGYEALVVTADVPVLGVRERDRRSRFETEEAQELPALRLLGREGRMIVGETASLFDPTVTWRDVERLASESPLPVLVKGILLAEDARRAVDHGAAGVVVSTHGGRQLDTVLASADALPPIVDEVGDEVDVLVDGGVRRGTDVLKGLALGARAVMVGRPVIWGLATGGAAGAQRVLELLLGELDNALALTGALHADGLDRSFVQHAPWANH
jgi:4-hydroxymandelate oxidase